MAKPRSRKKSKPKSQRAARAASRSGVRVRVYRHGLGDCLLVTLPKKDGSPFYIMIDCGLLQGSGAAAEEKLKRAIADIITTTGGRVDILVATHEHWDHVSGFAQFPEMFSKTGPSGKSLSAGQVWMGWTEDPSDPLARKLGGERDRAIRGLTAAVGAMKGLAGRAGKEATPIADGVDKLLQFFGAFGARKRTTSAGLETVRSMAPGKPRYCRPTDFPWQDNALPGVRIYALGPPLSEKMIKKTMSTKEVYEIADDSAGAETFFLSAEMAADPTDEDIDFEAQNPFDRSYRIPIAAVAPGGKGAGKGGGERDGKRGDEAGGRSEVQQFFNRFYWGLDTTSPYPDQEWRRIDGNWLHAAQDYALKLDSATNNTSLVLAIELIETGRVLLFAADAQVGNWLSWQDLSWKLDAHTTVTGPDLLRRTVFYKVGHHGSHNATLKEKGLEMMSDDLVAFIPVFEETARKNRWNHMPLPGLVSALTHHAKGRVVRTDEDFDGKAKPEHKATVKAFMERLTATDLYYEYALD